MALPGIITNPTFNPASVVIMAITQAVQALITTTTNITFVVGQSVRIVIPPATRAILTTPAFDYGMHEINGLLGNILVINSPTSFTIDIDTTLFQAFTFQPNATQLAQAVPVGEQNNQINGAWRNILNPVDVGLPGQQNPMPFGPVNG